MDDGIAALRRGAYAEAARLLDGASDLDARIALGHALWRMNARERAIDVLRDLDAPSARAIRAIALVDANRADEAAAIAVTGSWGALVRGEIAFAGGDLAAAQRCYVEAARDPDPEGPRLVALYFAGLATKLHGDDDAAALPHLELAFAVAEAELPPEHGLLGEICATLGECRRDDELLARAVRILAAAYGPDHARTTNAQWEYEYCFQRDRRAPPDVPLEPVGVTGIGGPPRGAGEPISAANVRRLRAVARFAAKASDCVATPDGCFVLAHRQGISILDAELRETRIASGSVYSACVVGDYVVASDEGFVSLWLRDGTFVRRLADEVWGHVRRLDDTRIVCSSRIVGLDGTVRELAVPISEQPPEPSPDGTRIAYPGNPVRVVDVATGRVDELPRGEDVAWIGDSLAIGTTQGVKLGDRMLGLAHAEVVYRLAPSPGGELVYTTGYDGVLGYVDVAGGVARTAMRTHRRNIVQFAATERIVAARCVDDTVRFHAIAPAPELPLVGPLPDGVVARFGPAPPWHAAPIVEQRDGELVVTVGADGTERTWDPGPRELVAVRTIGPHAPGAETRPTIDRQPVRAGVRALAMAARGGRVIVADEDHRVVVYTGEGAPERAIDEGRRTVWCVGFAPDGTPLYGADGLTWGEQRTAMPLGYASHVSAFAFSPSGDRVAVAGTSGDAAIVAWPSGELVRKLPHHRHHIWDIAWSPDGRWIAYGTDGTAIVWDVLEARPRILDDHVGSVGPVAFADGVLATGGSDRSIILYDLPSLALRHRLEGHTQTVDALAFGPGGLLASGGATFHPDGVRVWDAVTGAPVAYLHEGQHVSGLAWDGDRLLVAGDRADVLAYDLAWIRARPRPPAAPPRTRTHRLVGRGGHVAVWASAEHFDEHAIGLGWWDHDHEEHGGRGADRSIAESIAGHSYGPTFAPAVERACIARDLDARAFFFLYDHAWDADTGPCPEAPAVIYLGSFPFERG